MRVQADWDLITLWTQEIVTLTVHTFPPNEPRGDPGVCPSQETQSRTQQGDRRVGCLHTGSGSGSHWVLNCAKPLSETAHFSL